MSLLQPDFDARFLVDLVAATQAGLRRRAALRAALWSGAAVLAAATAILLADAATGFAAGGRAAVYGAVALGGAVALAAVTAATWLKVPAAAYVVRLIEQRRPDLRNGLITFLELWSGSLQDRSAGLAVAHRAARLLAEERPETLVPHEPLRRPAVAAAAAAAILGAAVWLAQGVLFEPWIGGAQANARPADSTPYASIQSPGAAPPGQNLPRGSAANQSPADRTSAAGPNRADDVSGQDQSASGGGPEGAAALALAQQMSADAGTLERLAAALGGSGPDPSSSGSGPGGAQTDAAAGRGSAKADASAPAAGNGQSAKGADPTGQPTSQNPGAATPGPSDAGNTREPGSGGTADKGGSTGTGGGAGSPKSPVGNSPPIPARPQPAELPKNALDATRWAERLIKEADARLRDGEVSEALLRDMGMSPAEFRRFVTTWKRRLGAAGGPDATGPAETARVGSAAKPGEFVRATGDASMKPIAGAVAAGHDSFQSVEDRAAGVAPRLRPYVEAYFEAVGRAADDAGPANRRK